MCNIGVNRSGIDKELILGKEIGKFGPEITERDRALNSAKINEGSEIVYKGNDGNWHLREVKEEGLLYGTNEVSRADKDEISLDANKMKKAGISNAVFSFVEDKFDLKSGLDDITEAFVAADPRTAPEILKKLSTVEGDNNFIKSHLLENPSITPEILKDLAEDKDPRIRILVSGNALTSIETLKKLAEDKDPQVRAAVIGNPRFPVELLKKLSSDESPIVRMAVARKPNISAGILNELSLDINGSVRSAVAGNPLTPKETLRVMKKDDSAFGVTLALAGNKNTPPDVLRQIFAGPEDGYHEFPENLIELCQTLRSNPAIPKDLLRPLDIKFVNLNKSWENELNMRQTNNHSFKITKW